MNKKNLIVIDCFDYGTFLNAMCFELPSNFPTDLAKNNDESQNKNLIPQKDLHLHPLQYQNYITSPYHSHPKTAFTNTQREKLSNEKESSQSQNNNSQTKLEPHLAYYELVSRRPYSLYARNVSVDVITHSDACFDNPKKSSCRVIPQQNSHGAIVSHDGEEKEDKTHTIRRHGTQSWLYSGSEAKNILSNNTEEDKKVSMEDSSGRGKTLSSKKTNYSGMYNRMPSDIFSLKPSTRPEDTGNRVLSNDGEGALRNTKRNEKKGRFMDESGVSKAFEWKEYSPSSVSSNTDKNKEINKLQRPVSASRIAFLKSQRGNLDFSMRSNEKQSGEVERAQKRMLFNTHQGGSSIGDLIWGGLPTNKTPQYQHIKAEEQRKAEERKAEKIKWENEHSTVGNNNTINNETPSQQKKQYYLSKTLSSSIF